MRAALFVCSDEVEQDLPGSEGTVSRMLFIKCMKMTGSLSSRINWMRSLRCYLRSNMQSPLATSQEAEYVPLEYMLHRYSSAYRHTGAIAVLEPANIFELVIALLERVVERLEVVHVLVSFLASN